MASENGMLEEAMEQFPGVSHAFAYGSGVFQQPGQEKLKSNGEQSMIDFIFAVDDPVSWHAANMERNRHHYSLLGFAGSGAVVGVAEKLGVGIHFNTLVPWKSQLIKYGVIRTELLLKDLSEWDTLYVAGRMQKPVATIASDERVAKANGGNLRSALAAALLLLPERFSERELHKTICGLSYTGDVRMSVAEDASKVDRIAEGSEAPLRALYQGAIADVERATSGLQAESGGERFAQDCSPAQRGALLRMLPLGMLARAAAAAMPADAPRPQQLLLSPGEAQGADSATRARAAALRIADALAARGRDRSAAIVRGALAAIVRTSSQRQLLTGLLQAGPLLAAKYVGRKMTKAWRSRVGAP